MGRSKKLNFETTNEKILGKLPKVKSNIDNLDFDENDIDGISILSFKTFDDLKEYYPLDKIQPQHKEEPPKKEPAKKRKIKDKGDKPIKPKVKRKAVIKQPAMIASNLTQFDKSESDGEEGHKSLFVKSEESPPPSPLPEIPQIPMSVDSVAAAGATIKSEGCSTSNTLSQTVTCGPMGESVIATTCGSGSPVYQPSIQHIRIPSTGSATVPHAMPTPPFSRPPSLPSRLPTSTPQPPAFYPGVHRHPIAGHGLPPFHYASGYHGGHDGQSAATADLAAAEMKLAADPRYLLHNGRLPISADISAELKLRAAEYDRYVMSRGLVGASRPLFPTQPPRPSHTPPVANTIIPGQLAPTRHMISEQTPVGGSGTAIKRQLNTMYMNKEAKAVPKIGSKSTSAFKRFEKKWNSIHVYIAHMIYKEQQVKKAKDPLNGAAPANNDAATRSFLANSKREVIREFPPFPGLHNFPPTPATPFPHTSSPFGQVHPGHPAISGLRGMPGFSGNRYAAPAMQPSYPGLGVFHPGFDSLRHPSIPNYHELSRLEQERAHQHLAHIRSTEMLSRSMYDMNALRQREHDLHTPHNHLNPRELMQQLHMDEQRKRLQASDAQKMLNANLYMHQQHLQSMKYPPVPHSAHVAQFPHLFSRLDPRNAARYSHLIAQPKGPGE